MVCRVRWMYRAPAMSLLYAGARLLCHGVSPCVAVCLTESMLALKWYSELIGPDYGVLSAKAHGPLTSPDNFAAEVLVCCAHLLPSPDGLTA